MEDTLSKEGAAKLVARLEAIYKHRVSFRIEQDLGGVYAVRSDMIRGVPRDGEPYQGYKEMLNVGKEGKKSKLSPNKGIGPNGGAAIHNRISQLKKQLTDRGICRDGEDRNPKDACNED